MDSIEFSGYEIDLDKLYELLTNHRVSCLSKFIDNNFTKNKDFTDSLKGMTNGTIRTQIMNALNDKYDVLRGGSASDLVNNVVDQKVEYIIKKVYQ